MTEFKSYEEFGGYIEFEYFEGSLYHDNAIALNCGRSCVEYFCKTHKVAKFFLPYFCCSSISNRLKKLGISFEYYSIDENFLPKFDRVLKEGEYLYIVNYYGQISNKQILEFKEKYKHIIVDNAQAYFEFPAASDIPTLYTCRKFFGVTDGAFLYSDKSLIDYDNLGAHLKRDESFKRMNFLFGRLERNASEFYAEYAANNELFTDEQVKQISKLTENLLRAIDYEKVKTKRTENFKKIHDEFESLNRLLLKVPEGAFMYPLWIANGSEIRKKLQNMRIYIPTLWPDVFELCAENTLEYELAKNTLPLPIDQRYSAQNIDKLIANISATLVDLDMEFIEHSKNRDCQKFKES